MAQKIRNVGEALQRAKEENEIFLGTLTREQLERSGFDTSTFQHFDFADVYLQYVDDTYRLKYVFDTSTLTEYYEKADQIGQFENLISVVASYICMAEENGFDDEKGLEHSMADIEMIERHPFGPEEGAVYVYRVAPRLTPWGMRMEVFYVATFDNGVTEIVWGAGSTPQLALESAISEWSRNGEEFNPFQRAFDETYAPEKRQE